MKEKAPYEYSRKLYMIYMIHDQYINPVYRTVMVTTNAHNYSKFSVSQNVHSYMFRSIIWPSSST